MDSKHGAVGEPPEHDVFGPVEDGEEIFEWIDDGTGPDEADEAGGLAVKQPAPTFRERLAAVRAGLGRLRHARRKIAAVAATLVLACAIGGACTAWFDGVAGATDRADVVSLAVDSVVNGDQASSSYNARDFSAVGQYVLDIANNSPDAVTLTSVAVEAGTLMTSTGWKPVGTARIAGGGTGKVALTVKLFCPIVTLNQQTGMFGAVPGTGGGSSLPFPAVHVQARDSDGDLRELVLPTRISSSAQLAAGQEMFRGPGGASIPEIISADGGACGPYTEAHAARQSSGGAARFPSPVTFGYDKVLTSAPGDDTFTLGFTVQNASNRTETLAAGTDAALTANDSQLRTEWLPRSLKLDPGQSATARLTVQIHDCTSILTGAPVLGDTMLQVLDSGGGPPEPVFIDQALTGSLRLAADIVKQEKAACS